MSCSKAMFPRRYDFIKTFDFISPPEIRHMFSLSKSGFQTNMIPGDPKVDCRKRPPTQGHQFKLSMSTLMKNLLQKQPHYIRCIKPNEQKAPKLFDKALVTSQIRYLGLVENVRVRRAGFSFRQSYSEFHNRYKMMR